MVDGAAPGESGRFCEAVNDDKAGDALSTSRLAMPSWMAFLRESESVLRLVAAAAGTEAWGEFVMLFDVKSRLTVARPERGCRSSCIISGDDERKVCDASNTLITAAFSSLSRRACLVTCLVTWTRYCQNPVAGSTHTGSRPTPCPSFRPRGRAHHSVLFEKQGCHFIHVYMRPKPRVAP